MVPTTDTVRSAFLLQTLAGTRSDDVDGDDHGRGGTIEIIEVSEIRYDHYMITIWTLYDHYMITIWSLYDHYYISLYMTIYHYISLHDEIRYYMIVSLYDH